MGLAALPFCFAPILLLLLPGFYAFIGAAWGLLSFGVCLSASALAVVLAAGLADFSSLLLLALYVPATLLLYHSLHKRLPWRSAVWAGSLAMGLGLYLLLCLPSLLAGNGPFGDFEDTFRFLGDQLALAAPQMGFSAAQVSQIRTYSAYLQLTAPSLVTGTLVSMAMVFGLAAPLIGRGLCRAAGVQTRPMARFANWQIDKNLAQGLGVFLAGALVVYLLGINNAGAVITAVECIAGGPFLLMGLCCIAYLRAVRGRGAGYLAAMYIAMVVLLPLSLYILVTLGFMDRVLRLRRQRPLP